MKLLDLFCGMGGWSIGFHREGFECWGVDRVDVGYPYNLILKDIKDYEPERVYDVIVASPPCTEFSPLTVLSWKKGQRGPPEPEKGVELVNEAWRIITMSNPKFYVLENVHGSIPYINPIFGEPRIIARPWVLWGNFPDRMFDSLPKMGKGGNRIGLPEDFPFDPLRSWKRARIPVFLSTHIARACREELE